MLVGVRESTARTRYMLFGLLLSKVLWKEVSIVNHCVDPGNLSAEEMIKNVYPLLKRCWVRDNLSKINLEKLGIKSAEFVPDALYKFENLNNNSSNVNIFVLVIQQH